MVVINMGLHLLGGVLMEYGIQAEQAQMEPKMQNGHFLFGYRIELFQLQFPMMFYFMNHFMHLHIQLGTVQKIQQRYIVKMHETFLEGKNI